MLNEVLFITLAVLGGVSLVVTAICVVTRRYNNKYHTVNTERQLGGEREEERR